MKVAEENSKNIVQLKKKEKEKNKKRPLLLFHIWNKENEKIWKKYAFLKGGDRTLLGCDGL